MTTATGVAQGRKHLAGSPKGRQGEERESLVAVDNPSVRTLMARQKKVTFRDRLVDAAPRGAVRHLRQN